MKRLTKVDRVEALIDALEIDENVIKEHIIKKIWGVSSDYYVRRSFDVTFNEARKRLPEKEFKSADQDKIVRIK